MTDELLSGLGIPARDGFTEAEAIRLLGRRYRATVAYSGVPAGTIGRVFDYYRRGGGLHGVDIVWELPPGSPLPVARRTDGYSRADLFCVVRGGPLEGHRAMVPLDAPDGGQACALDLAIREGCLPPPWFAPTSAPACVAELHVPAEATTDGVARTFICDNAKGHGGERHRQVTDNDKAEAITWPTTSSVDTGGPIGVGLERGLDGEAMAVFFRGVQR